MDRRRFSTVCRRSWSLEQFGLNADHMTVGVIAQLIARKGHRHMIRAIPTVLSAEPRARFLILGRGPLRTELERLCRQARIIEQVRFTGYRTDIDKILTSLDPVVHLAEMEGLGVALLESAAAGIPIVASKTGGIPEVVRNGKKGVFPHFHRK